MSLLSSMEEACMGGKTVAPDGDPLPPFEKAAPLGKLDAWNKTALAIQLVVGALIVLAVLLDAVL